MQVVDFTNPNDFFYSKVGQATSELNINLSLDLEYYLVNLLCDFIRPESLTIDELDLFDTPLALIYKKALEATPQTQLKVYKKLGDVSLYISGYFQDSLNRKIVSQDYYISMGASAYHSASRILSHRHKEKHFTRMYRSLSKEFSQLVKVITKVANSLPANHPVMLDQIKLINQGH